jgi:DNA-binding response OmpR family regulator
MVSTTTSRTAAWRHPQDGTHADSGTILAFVPEILIATDTKAVFDEISSVVAGRATRVRWVRKGEDVREEMNLRPADLAILDSQISTMGGIAVALDLRLEADAGRSEPRPVLLVLDRRPDVFMARRSGAEGWILRPLDPIRLRKATTALLAGGTWHDTSFLPDPVAVPFG